MGLFGKKKTSGEQSAGDQKVTFGDLGMHCGNCAASVEGALKKAPGVKSVTVDLKGQSATAVFDPSVTNVETLRAAVKKAGYVPKSESTTGA